MILNGYAILDAFVSLLRLGLGLLVLGLGVSAWRAWGRHALEPEVRKALEDRCYLLFLLAGFLLALNIVSWPIFYLLLQSYVPEWPGVMCIYGVTRIGAGSHGVSRFLPPLLQALQAAKPALVFLSGAWFVLYLVNRRTSTAPLTGRVLLVLLAAGTLAVGDAAAEVTYLIIPKKEEFPSGGCCTQALTAESFTTRFLVGEGASPWLSTAYFGGNALLVLALLFATWRPHSPPGPLGLALLLLGGVGVLVTSGLFLIEVAAPTLLHLPYHRCPYDLVGRVPEAVVAVALFLGGCFFLGWAGVVRGLGRCPETEPFLLDTVHNLLRLSLWGFLMSLMMLSLELALA